ncbi:peptide chain release factor N(5)-glutamine methyltransferase [Porphyromonas circumdentaria]|uniref:peptide chain release factor N(5)-glutamine methyltransferase n=1 Tax=Porphyromonas circumdentaria TaxID=29524 RepID=A0A1T4NEC0_9PORP|nr:peptide chain release factor N(5)-glutamine methyltransferase [Porphyromonas circumdentaria]MBB6275634.1 release factor glutamine methyltransferase [Porphyromonas circumdentaria]MDO4721874.1 peptide chain release factor N(5)-glutamine methyltransferase [Porphyromonas circumdentaria]SJZ77128.1 release factor glutamine methyltransferase [Porphyromonas circumdentaria]
MLSIEQARTYIQNSIEHLYPPEECRFIALDLLGVLCSWSRSQVLLAEAHFTLSDEKEQQLKAMVHRLQSGEPIQYIQGSVEFGALRLSVGRGVLIPRPETEEMVALILQEMRNKTGIRYLDIGTGSGCIALSLAYGLRGSRGFALEKSPEAREIADKNIQYYQQENKIAPLQLIAGDLFAPEEWLHRIEIPIDLVVSNPPYVQVQEAKDMAPHVLKSEPSQALFAPEDNPLYYYEGIIHLCHALPLAPKARLYVEINALLGGKTQQLFEMNPLFREVKLLKDLSGRDRFITATMIPQNG